MPTRTLAADADRPLVPTVGMPCTICHWTDREPAHVSHVSPGGKLLRTRDAKWRAVDIGHNYFGHQEYLVEADPEGNERTFTLRKDGRWRARGGQGPSLSLGHARRYHDPHF